MNNISLIGNLTNDPELKFTQGGSAICAMSVAYNEKYRDKSGELQSDVSYFDIKTFGKLSETCAQHLHKGSKIGITGKLKQSRWEDKDGNKRNKVEIIASNIEFLTPKSGAASNTEDDEPSTGDIPF